MIIKNLFRNKTLVILLAIMLFVGFSGSYGIQLASYTTAFEGAKARFHGVTDAETSVSYTTAEKGEASIASFDTLMKFDRDETSTGSCNIHGEMSSVQIPMGASSWIPPEWVPSEWWRDSLLWQNPTETYEWKIRNSDGSFSVYRMEEWATKWFISLSAEWDSGPDAFWSEDEAQNRRYFNLEVWMEIDVSPTWYFEGQEEAYFAIAKVELSDVSFTEGSRVDPMSPGSVLTVYSEPFFGSTAATVEELTSFYYENKTLNPQYFNEKVYVYINLADFGTREYWDLLALKAQGDTVTFGFTVTQFVVGEWLVQDVQDVEEYTGRSSKVGATGLVLPDFLAGLFEWWNGISLWSWLGLGGFGLGTIAVIVAVVLLWFFGLPKILRRNRGG